jgi:hypothetical protein
MVKQRIETLPTLEIGETLAGISALLVGSGLWLLNAQYTVEGLVYMVNLGDHNNIYWGIPPLFTVIQIWYWPSKASDQGSLGWFIGVSLFDWATTLVGAIPWLGMLMGVALVFPPDPWTGVTAALAVILSLFLAFLPEVGVMYALKSIWFAWSSGASQ